MVENEKHIVKVERVTVRFGHVKALDNVSLAMPPGATLLVGPNGSGKTTLLKLIAGLVKPTRGRVRVLGLDPVRDADRLNKLIIYVRDVNDIHPSTRVGTYLELLASVHGDIVYRVAEKLGLEEHMGKRYSELSHGLRRRLALLEALAADRKLVLLDEPLTGLDRESRRVIIEALREKLESGANLVVASHIPLNLPFNTLIVLEAGRVTYQGPFSVNVLREYVEV